MSVAERADDGVTVDAEMTRTLPAFAGAPFVGLGTASSELLRRAINDSVVATFGDGHPCGLLVDDGHLRGERHRQRLHCEVFAALGYPRAAL